MMTRDLVLHVAMQAISSECVWRWLIPQCALRLLRPAIIDTHSHFYTTKWKDKSNTEKQLTIVVILPQGAHSISLIKCKSYKIWYSHSSTFNCQQSLNKRYTGILAEQSRDQGYLESKTCSKHCSVTYDKMITSWPLLFLQWCHFLKTILSANWVQNHISSSTIKCSILYFTEQPSVHHLSLSLHSEHYVVHS